MTHKKFAGLISLLLFTLTIACSDSASEPDIDDETGQASFSLSGDLQGSFEGESFFVTINAGGFFTANLSIADDTDQESFLLVFATTSTSSISVPSGTYTIGLPESEVGDGSVFVATLTDFTGNTPKIIQTTTENAGTLTVSRSTDRILEGTFRYDARGDAGEEVTVEGSFTAVK